MNDDFEKRETSAPRPDPEAELRAIRGSLRRRSLKIVLTSVVLVLAILIGAVKFAVPALEKQYWDPAVCTYLEDVTDLELTMAVYNELFGHGQYFLGADIQKRGFADYSVNAFFAEQKTITSKGSPYYRFASLTKGEFLCPPNFWMEPTGNFFLPSITPETAAQYRAPNNQAKQALRALPDYVQVYASVTFSKDMSLGQLQEMTFQSLPEDGRFIWAILRSGDASDGSNSPCGVHLMNSQWIKYSSDLWEDTAYPKLFVDPYFCTGKDLDQHVKSMLKFSADQLQKGEDIVPPGEDPDYYTKALDYMEENGVKAYGSYVIATPQALLEMMDEGLIAYIRLLDARIGI